MDPFCVHRLHLEMAIWNVEAVFLCDYATTEEELDFRIQILRRCVRQYEAFVDRCQLSNYACDELMSVARMYVSKYHWILLFR